MNILSPKQRASGALRVALIKGLAARSGDPRRAERIADDLGESALIKAAVAPITTTDNPLAFAPLDPQLSDGFIDSLRSLNALDASSASMIKVASNSAVQIIAATATGSLTQEGKPKPATQFSVAAQSPSMRKVTALAVVNDEVLRSVNAQNVVEGALRGGVALGSGALLLSVLADGATSVAASGTDAAAFLADLGAALAQIKVGAGSRLFAAVAPDLLKRLALLDSDKLLDVTVNGGSVAGVELVPDDSIEVDSSGSTITVFDASRVLLADEGVAVRASREAALELDDAPSDPTNAGAIVHSLFAENRTALLAERYAGVAKASADCCALITGANYGA